ncbi:MAG: hypothetical protein JKY53_05525 [Flavobacteriales bacterium]|nr:hypothetical protein [Flavobacteriales bacterium]
MRYRTRSPTHRLAYFGKMVYVWRMKEETRPDRFSRTIDELAKYMKTDKGVDTPNVIQASATVTFHAVTNESIKGHVFDYKNLEDFIIDLKIVYINGDQSYIESTAQKIIKELGYDENSNFSLEMKSPF